MPGHRRKVVVLGSTRSDWAGIGLTTVRSRCQGFTPGRGEVLISITTGDCLYRLDTADRLYFELPNPEDVCAVLKKSSRKG